MVIAFYFDLEFHINCVRLHVSKGPIYILFKVLIDVGCR